MPRCAFVRPLLVSVLLTAANAAMAQSAPPIKPGLWEIRLQTEGSGQQMPDMSDRLKNLPPEQRAMVEAKMKQSGVSIGAGGVTVRQCLDAQSLTQGGWLSSGSAEHRDSERCHSDITDRSSGIWKFHVACTEPTRVSDGEANFSNAEGYTLKITSTSTEQGVPHVSHIALNATWVGATCGDQKP